MQTDPRGWNYSSSYTEFKRRRRALLRQRIAYCQHPNCVAPDIPIDYEGPRHVIDSEGRRRLNPWSFEADHVIPRAEGGTHDYLRACHSRCNRLAGAKLGAKRRWGTAVRSARPQPVHTRQW